MIRSLLVVCVALCLFLSTPILVALDEGETKWFKGGVHNHTNESDGDSPANKVVEWFIRNGYDFAAITDHNFFTDPAELNMEYGSRGFLLLGGEEVSLRVGKNSLHIVGLNIKSFVKPSYGRTLAEVMEKNSEAIRQSGGIPQISHPNRDPGLSAEELMSAQGWKLLEIYNASPSSKNEGSKKRPSVEAVWDTILSTGREVYGIGVDDAHHFSGNPYLGARTAGAVWISVRARELTAEAIGQALERGQFYSSTGPQVLEWRADRHSIQVSVDPKKSRKYTIQFIGKNGKLLQETQGPEALYEFTGEELYVRAKVIDSKKKVAWLQPVFLPWSEE